MGTKKIGLLVVIFCLVLIAGSAHAVVPFDAIYMVDSEFSTTQKDIFDFNDPSPWIYLNVPVVPAYNVSLSFYVSPTDDHYWTYELNNTGEEIWISLDDGYQGLLPPQAIDWIDIKEIGTWEVTAKYAGCGSGCELNYGTTSFTVVPEPVSSMLFLVGAATLGFRRFRKK